ncbi:MarR family winged helix-turn-helix transcriptional regulator [Nonomuraea muscovyensis]|uniref:DNA-binding MarR family transcriptional regulator n=1 Tax=Nonomuraea muscovyensis TaxID=1124761 RepID=A0A7X0CB05_9ACTN|nr:MarR family transcriptional regulator [Nonomuraea muscovyensis]MBB6351699.1 DNA-binding MarR family transcriptional regulator [Nonomuraea muscovyensis]MDF2709486.1 MarR family transcriptional regulator [Nonomuraea muscovyensis]
MTTPDQDRPALLDEIIGAAIPGWAITVVQLNNVVATRLGVTDTDVQCLHALGRHGPATPGVLAKRVNLTTGSASRMIDRLVAAGCVRRVPDPDDRRRVLIEPTQEGLDRVGAAYAGLIDRTRDDLEDFTDEELRGVLRFIRAAERSTAAEIHRLRSAPDDREPRPDTHP